MTQQVILNHKLLKTFAGPPAFGSQWEHWLIYAWHRMQDHIDLNQIIRVDPQSCDSLYDDQSAARTLRYSPGQRPMLEAALAGAAHSEPRLKSNDPQAIVEALLQWVYWEVFRRGEVLRRDKWSKQLIGGGTEEETLAFIGRTGTFECARLLATLLQIKNISARLVLVFEPQFNARVCVEAFIQNHWQLYDIANNTQHPSAQSLLKQPPADFANATMGIIDYPAKDALKQELPVGYPVADDQGREFDAHAALDDRLNNQSKHVQSAAQLQAYTGWNKLHGEAAKVNEYHANEPPMTQEVVMCAQTQDFLYNHFTPTHVEYTPGNRPVLEGLLATCVLRDKPRPADDQDLVFAVHDWVFHQVLFRYLALFPLIHKPRFRYFGNDEDVASFRNRCDCYCASKLAASMLQTAGISARLVYMENAENRGGHTCFEAYVRGAWRFWDVSCHDHALNREGQVANIWEIMSDEYCRTTGLREDTIKPTPIKRPEYLSNLGIGNYPIAQTTAHYNQAQGSFWYEPGSLLARKSARFGI